LGELNKALSIYPFVIFYERTGETSGLYKNLLKAKTAMSDKERRNKEKNLELKLKELKN